MDEVKKNENFAQVPTSLLMAMVKALASQAGYRTLALKAYILTKVCRRENGYQGLIMNEFKLEPRELVENLGFTPTYARRMLQVLKNENWASCTGVPGVYAIDPGRVYETVENRIKRKKSQVANKLAFIPPSSTPFVMSDVTGDVLQHVPLTVTGGVMPTSLKANGGVVFRPPQECKSQEDKTASLLSPSSPPGDVSAGESPWEQGGREPDPAADAKALSDAEAVRTAYNEVADARGIRLLSEEDFKKLLPEILAVLADPEGYPLRPAISGMLIVPSTWYAKFQPNYRFDYLLERKARKTWTEKLTAKSAAKRKGSEKTNTSTASDEGAEVGTRTSKKRPAGSLEERMGIATYAKFHEFCVAYGNPLRIDREVDGPEASRLVAVGETTWDELCSLATAQAELVSGPDRIKGMTRWLAMKPWLLPAMSVMKKPKNARQSSDDEFQKAKASQSAQAVEPQTQETENALARMVRQAEVNPQPELQS